MIESVCVCVCVSLCVCVKSHHTGWIINVNDNPIIYYMIRFLLREKKIFGFSEFQSLRESVCVCLCVCV